MTVANVTTRPAVDWASRLRLVEDSFTPLYRQLESRLRAIATELEPGTLMPSEKELMEYARVGRATVRRAVESLVQAGVLISRQGRGTFTAPRRVEAPLAGPAGFTETMRHLGRESSTEVLWTEVEPASDVVAEHLGLAEGDSVVAFERLRKVDDVPAMLERCHLPELLFPAFPTASLTGSLYELLERRYGLRPATGVETIYSVNADDRLAYTLDAVVGSALLATVRVTHTDANVPMEYTVRYARGDVCSFRVNLDEDSKLTGRDGAVNVLALGRRHGAGSGAV